MTGFFGNINPDEIPDGPKAGKYTATITDVEVNRKSKKGGNFIVFSYTIDDSGFDFPVLDWFSFPENPDPNSWDRTTPINDKGQTQWVKAMQDLKWFKRRLLDFGVPRDKVNQVLPQHLIGQKINVVIEMDGDFPQVKSVSAIGTSSGATLPGGGAPTAPATPAPAATVAPAAAPAPAFTPQASFQAPATADAAAPVGAAAPPVGVNALTDVSANPFAGME